MNFRREPIMVAHVAHDSASVEVLLHGRTYLEAPRWHEGALYVSDIPADEVLRVQLDGTVDVIAAQPGLHPSGLGWMGDGTMVAVAVFERQLVVLDDPPSSPLRSFADLSLVATSITNDMTVDASGRAFIGQAGSNISAGEPVVPAPLLRVDPDGSVHDVGGELLCANGIVVHEKTLIVAETFADRLSAFDVDASGALHRQRVWAQLPRGYGPDGICLDAQGAVWAACPYAESFVRVT